MCFGSVQIISRLDSQNKFQMFTLFSGRHTGVLKGPPTWRPHTRLYNFARNISTNISTLGQRTHCTLGKLSSLSSVYNITISWLNPLHGFWFCFLLRGNQNTLKFFYYLIQYHYVHNSNFFKINHLREWIIKSHVYREYWDKIW